MKKFYIVLLLTSIGLMCNACSTGMTSAQSNKISSELAVEVPVAESYDMDVADDYLAGYSDYEKEYGIMAEASPSSGAGGVSTETVEGDQNDKIIKTCGITLESGNFDAVVSEIRRIVDSRNGYVENSNSYSRIYAGRELRRYNATLKIPAEHYETAKAAIESLGEELGKIKSINENASNVSAQYYDIESRLKSKRIEEERLLDMVSKAANLKDLLALEDRLTQVRTTIEQYQSSLSRIDKQVAYSTIDVSLDETTGEWISTPSDSLSDRLRESFRKSVNLTVMFLQEIIIFIAGIIIPMIIIAILIIIGVSIYKRKKKKGETENEEKHD